MSCHMTVIRVLGDGVIAWAVNVNFSLQKKKQLLFVIVQQKYNVNLLVKIGHQKEFAFNVHSLLLKAKNDLSYFWHTNGTPLSSKKSLQKDSHTYTLTHTHTHTLLLLSLIHTYTLSLLHKLFLTKTHTLSLSHPHSPSVNLSLSLYGLRLLFSHFL